jgi:hypothetical protein
LRFFAAKEWTSSVDEFMRRNHSPRGDEERKLSETQEERKLSETTQQERKSSGITQEERKFSTAQRKLSSNGEEEKVKWLDLENKRRIVASATSNRSLFIRNQLIRKMCIEER